MTEANSRIDLGTLSKQLAGQVVAEVAQPTPESIAVHFTTGAILALRLEGNGIAAVLTQPKRGGKRTASAPEPTRRQREYLEFIMKYMHSYGVGPAETDVERHFLVSAPSVNQMVQTLERRGFITRERDWSGRTVPRSIRVVWED